MDRTHSKSLIQKLVFSSLHFSFVILSAWIIYFSGWQAIGDFFKQEWQLSDPNRATALFFCMLLYWSRHVITLFYLLARKISWSEVFGLLPFFGFFEIGLLLIGAGVFRDHAIPFYWLDLIALVLLGIGSYLNSFSEIQRKWWKANPDNKGHCYTKGLFSHSMHINFFGDIVLFTGWCLLSTNLWTLALPLLMAAMFILHHIPNLDKYLANRYGKEFVDYAQRTKKLIPYFY